MNINLKSQKDFQNEVKCIEHFQFLYKLLNEKLAAIILKNWEVVESKSIYINKQIKDYKNLIKKINFKKSNTNIKEINIVKIEKIISECKEISNRINVLLELEKKNLVNEYVNLQIDLELERLKKDKDI